MGSGFPHAIEDRHSARPGACFFSVLTPEHSIYRIPPRSGSGVFFGEGTPAEYARIGPEMNPFFLYSVYDVPYLIFLLFTKFSPYLPAAGFVCEMP